MKSKSICSSLLLGAVFLGSVHAGAAQTIYKCSKPDGGTVFSPTPCGANAKEVDTSRALRRGTAPNLQGVSDNAAVSRIDGDCQNRSLAIEARYRSDYRNADRDESRLNQEKSHSSNNYAGATRDNGIRTQLAEVDQRRSDLGRSERQEQGDLRKECEDARSAERKRQADRDAMQSTPAK